jgi:hypothetical protein
MSEIVQRAAPAASDTRARMTAPTIQVQRTVRDPVARGSAAQLAQVFAMTTASWNWILANATRLAIPRPRSPLDPPAFFI